MKEGYQKLTLKKWTMNKNICKSKLKILTNVGTKLYNEPLHIKISQKYSL